MNLFKEITNLFLEDAPKPLAEINQAITDGNAQALEKSAHKLKESTGKFAAKNAFEAVLKLEMMV